MPQWRTTVGWIAGQLPGRTKVARTSKLHVGSQRLIGIVDDFDYRKRRSLWQHRLEKHIVAPRDKRVCVASQRAQLARGFTTKGILKLGALTPFSFVPSPTLFTLVLTSSNTLVRSRIPSITYLVLTSVFASRTRLAVITATFNNISSCKHETRSSCLRS